MKFFTNKSIWSKIVIALIFVLLFEFVVACPVRAADDDSKLNTGLELGGKLMSPILSLVVSLADAMLGIMHDAIMGVNSSLQEVSLAKDWYDWLGTAFKVVLTVAILAVGIVCTAGLGSTLVAVGAAVMIWTKAFGFNIGDAVFDTTMDAIGIKGVEAANVTAYTENNLPETLYLPAYTFSPEEIFQGKILLFNVNFFSDSKEIKEKTGPVLDKDGNDTGKTEVKYYYYEDENGNEVITSKQDMASQLQSTVASWYVGIRNIALVGMMIVLLYIGIRMMLSTMASDKAKYKQLLQDWLVGIILLFFIHYIMAFSVTLIQKITCLIGTTVDEKGYMVVIPDDSEHKLTNYFKDTGNKDVIVNENLEPDENGGFVMYPTNLLGKMRLKLQLSNWGTEYVGYSLCFVVLVMFTAYFAFIYLRRVLYMAFLTLIAPMVALTYPIDKVSDGSAQGFSKWFKEYMFNLLLQPMHLLLYYILVTSAFNLASENIIYSLVAIGFMIPAEKLLRSLFGFEKAHTPGVLAGPAGAALTMGAVQKLNHLRMPKPPKFADKGGATSINEANNKQLPRFNEDFDEAGIMAGVGGAEPAADNANLPTGNVSQEEIDADNELQKELNERKARGEDIGKEQAALDAMRQKDNFDKVNEPNESEALEQQPLQLKENEETKKKIKDMPKKARMKYFARNVMHNPKTRAAIGMAGRVGKTAGAVSLGVAAGAVGAATGIVTGSPGDVWKNAAIGASAGYTGGKTIGDGIGGGKIQNNIKEAIDRDYERARQNDENFNAYVEEKQVRASEKAYRKALKRNNFSKEEIDKLSQNGTLERYIRNEVSAEDAATGEVMRRDDASLSQDEVIATAKYSERVGDAVKGPDREKWKEHFTKEFSKKANLDETRAKRVADATLDRVERFQKQRKKLIK